MSTSLQECPRCLMEARLRGRNFSDQATAALLVWEEIDRSLIGEAICDMCYGELRDVLIERASELETGKLITPAERREAYAKAAASTARAAAAVAKSTVAAPAPTVGKTPAASVKAVVAAKPATAGTTKGAAAAAKTSPIGAKKAAAKKPAPKKVADTKKKSVKKAG